MKKEILRVTDTHQLLVAAKKYNLIPKIHVNQFNAIGGVEAGVQHQALSVDHLEILTDDDLVGFKRIKNNACSLTILFLFFKHSLHSSKKNY